MQQTHAFSIDLEDWYQGIELSQEHWKGKEYRLENGLEPILSLLKKYDTRATFFCLGWLAKKHKNVIRKIAHAGHEIASHGFSHEKIYNLNKDSFREEVRKTRSLLEDASGLPVTGNRAPYFSITQNSLWALEILKAEGFLYDSSISPITTWRYGIRGTPDDIYRIKELDLVEFPISTATFLGKKIGVGGAYFRIFPYFIFKKVFSSESEPKMFYAHPWEFDPDHPVISFNWKAKLTHYHNLRNMTDRVEKLLSSFKFSTVSSVIEYNNRDNHLKEISINSLKK